MQMSKENDFYVKAQKYWSEVPATVNGMLGGLGYISAIDIQSSSTFLRELNIKDMNRKHALDCGAGIGRVSKHLLMPLFGKVDLVEQDQAFAEQAKVFCTQTSDSMLDNSQRLGEIYNVGLQEFRPNANQYDLVWSQWVLGHLTDEDLLRFFERIKDSLNAEGTFVIKENVTSSRKIDEDVEDSSVTRPLKTYEKYLKQAGFRILKITQQKNFPKGLYPVYMIACRPTSKEIA